MGRWEVFALRHPPPRAPVFLVTLMLIGGAVQTGGDLVIRLDARAGVSSFFLPCQDFFFTDAEGEKKEYERGRAEGMRMQLVRVRARTLGCRAGCAFIWKMGIVRLGKGLRFFFFSSGVFGVLFDRGVALLRAEC